MQKIGYKLKLLRMAHVFGKDEVALMLGITVRAYTKLEKGTAEINLAQLCKLCDFYKLRKSTLLGGENLALSEAGEEMTRLMERLKEAEETLAELKRKTAGLRGEV